MASKRRRKHAEDRASAILKEGRRPVTDADLLEVLERWRFREGEVTPTHDRLEFGSAFLCPRLLIWDLGNIVSRDADWSSSRSWTGVDGSTRTSHARTFCQRGKTRFGRTKTPGLRHPGFKAPGVYHVKSTPGAYALNPGCLKPRVLVLLIGLFRHSGSGS